MSLLDQVRSLPQQVIDRLKELEPLAREYDQLRKFAQRLGLNYSPDTANTDDDAQPTPTTRATPTKRATATRARAQTRSRSAPAKAARRSSGRTRASTSSAAPQSTRATRATRQRTADSAPATNARSANTTGRTRKGRSAGTSGQRSGGRRVGAARAGQRDEDVLRLVGEHPGITVREIAKQLGVDTTGLYRVVKRLTDDGRLRKDGTRLQPVQAATAPSPTPPTPTDMNAATDALTEVLEKSAPADESSPTTAATSAPTDET